MEVLLEEVHGFFSHTETVHWRRKMSVPFQTTGGEVLNSQNK